MSSRMPASRSMSPSLNNTTDGEFTVFPKLPPEIRLNIWDHASFLPRDVDIFVVPMGNIRSDQITFNPFKFVSSKAVPTILHTSKEAREAALKHYKPQFGVQNDFPGFSLYTTDRIYFNPIADRAVFFGTASFDALDNIPMVITRFVRRIAVNVHLEHGTEDWDDSIDLLSNFDDWFGGHLEEVALFCSQKTIKKGDKFHFKDFNMENANKKRGKVLIKAKEKVEKEAKHILLEEEEYRKQQRAKLAAKGKQPCACLKQNLSAPVIQLVSIHHDE